MVRRFLPFLLFLSTAVHAGIEQAEREALLAFFNATGGPRWSRNDGWGGQPGTECNWTGITCDPTGSTVVRIQLDSNRLEGSIPPQIRALKNLEWLIVARNRLSSSIPVELTELSELKALALETNDLSGPISPGIGRLAGLIGLGLYGNRLSGEIPALIGLDFLSAGGALEITSEPGAGTTLAGRVPTGDSSVMRS